MHPLQINTTSFKDSHAVYCLHAGDKIKLKPYLHPVTVATITEIGPSLWINDDRYTVYSDKPLIPFMEIPSTTVTSPL
jgi:hypothetical protein